MEEPEKMNTCNFLSTTLDGGIHEIPTPQKHKKQNSKIYCSLFSYPLGKQNIF